MLAPQKEVHFFDVHWDRGWEWYVRQFADGAPGALWIDASPTYMWWPPARERMLSTLPRARYVVMVRDPVDRAWSHYWYMRARGREALDFEAALDAEEVRLEGADLEVARTVSYASRGRYAPQVAALLEGAGVDAVHVVGFPQLRDDPAAVVDGVLRHLRLAPRSLVPSPDRNTAVPWRSSRVEGLAGRLPGRARRWVRQRNRTQVGAQRSSRTPSAAGSPPGSPPTGGTGGPPWRRPPRHRAGRRRSRPCPLTRDRRVPGRASTSGASTGWSGPRCRVGPAGPGGPGAPSVGSPRPCAPPDKTRTVRRPHPLVWYGDLDPRSWIGLLPHRPPASTSGPPTSGGGSAWCGGPAATGA